MQKQWIVNREIDLSFWLIGIPVFFLATIELKYLFLALSLIVLVFLDNGHIFLTYIRIFKEKKKIFTFSLFSHLLCFIFFLAFQVYQLKYLWHLVLYATLFHFIRQYFGILRWYKFLDNHPKQKTIPRRNRLLNILFHLNLYLPVICFHFRKDSPALNFFSENDMFSFPNSILFTSFLLIYLLSIASWFLLEIICYISSKKIEWIRLGFICTSFILFGMIGFFAKSAMEVILPLAAAHGLQYYALHCQMTNKYYFKNIYKTIITTLLIGLFIGSTFSYFEHQFDTGYEYLNKFNLLNSIGIAIVLTPLFHHYIIDTVIWTRKYMQKL